MAFDEMKGQITEPIGCLDCHDPKIMELRISRSALAKALERQVRDLDKSKFPQTSTRCQTANIYAGCGGYFQFSENPVSVHGCSSPLFITTRPLPSFS